MIEKIDSINIKNEKNDFFLKKYHFFIEKNRR